MSGGSAVKTVRPAGNRVKTDAKDAEHLCRLLRLDEIVEVIIPDTEQEAARDLVRAREDVRGDLMRARHRASKLLLRQGIVYPAAKPGRQHMNVAAATTLRAPARQLAFEDAVEAVLLTTDRRDRLDAAIEAMAADSSYTPLVRRLGCLRGISTLTGFGLAVEIGDWHRFTGSSIGAFLGLVPTEDSSGESQVPRFDHQGRQRPCPPAAGGGRLAPPQELPQPRQDLRDRWQLAPSPARVRGHEGNRRLHQRWQTFQGRRKKDTIAAVAIARELAGWAWSLAVMDD